ncbi:hypothetical protein FS837_012259 [Tulasnella sp. UAMH 9824]|nr:hypothetical protein FS837_012259 [Tulasnella sp. UAMH 9824]
MNPATNAMVDFAVDLLLQSMYDENKNALDSVRRITGRPGDAEMDTGMLSQVDNHAAAIKLTLDAVQCRLFDKISALHTEHNRMIPLHKLPIEIFVQVITEALEPFQTRQWARPTHLGRLVTLCQVCKRWRDVINKTASLWATIDIRDPAVVISAAVIRSANHPLNLIGAPSSYHFRHWSSTSGGWEEFVKTAIAHSTRWRSIQLAVGSSEAALAVMNAHAPRLQSLEVYSAVECRLDTRTGASTLHTIGPRLRRLCLRGLAIPWRSAVLHDLRYLYISGLDEFVPSCEEMLAALQECAMLVELVLSLEPTASVETPWKGPSFTLAQLESISISRPSTSWALVLLETIRTPSAQLVDLDLDFSISSQLFPSAIKRIVALFSDIIDSEYWLGIYISPSCLSWSCQPTGKPSNWRKVAIKAWNKPASETLDAIWAETESNGFGPECIRLEFFLPPTLEFPLCLPKLDRMNPILSVAVTGCDLGPLFTYMSNPTTSSEWGLPELENLAIDDCRYEPPRLLEMVLARYEGEGSEGSDISDNERDRPPPFKDLTIYQASGEADVETLDLVADIVGHDCFTLEQDEE